jgi:hypothetical protein
MTGADEGETALSLPMRLTEYSSTFKLGLNSYSIVSEVYKKRLKMPIYSLVLCPRTTRRPSSASHTLLSLHYVYHLSRLYALLLVNGGGHYDR